MIETTNPPLTRAQEREEQLGGLLAKILSAAQPGAVFGEPVTKGAYTVITASEVSAGGGFGSGVGSALLAPKQREAASDGSLATEKAQPVSSGGGMGGGGGSSGRPVALIIIGADGVRVRPVVDVTKIALAGVTVLGTVVALLWRKRRRRRRRRRRRLPATGAPVGCNASRAGSSPSTIEWALCPSAYFNGSTVR